MLLVQDDGKKKTKEIKVLFKLMGGQVQHG